MEKLAIIIPAYNEEKRIAGTLEEYGRFFTNLKKTKKIDSEIIIVINNTQDKTEEIVKGYKKKYGIVRYLNFKQGGKGFAIIEGFKEALKDKKNSLIGFVDADMATSPESFYDLVKNINGFDGIMGSRSIQGAKINPKRTWKRAFVSRIFNFLIKVLFLMPFSDTQCGAKVFKRKTLENVTYNLGMSQWAFDVELLYLIMKAGFKIREYPTVWADKEYSKINFMKAGPRMALSVIRLRLINSPLAPLLKPVKIIAKFGDWLINKK